MHPPFFRGISKTVLPERIIYFIRNCIFSLQERTFMLSVSSRSCLFRNNCTSNGLSVIFCCSSVYLIAITRNPHVLVYYSIHNKLTLFGDCLPIVILAVNNSTENLKQHPHILDLEY